MKPVILFKTTRDAVRAQRLCKRNDISCKVIPVPRDISSECGMALEIDKNDLYPITEIFIKNSINHDIYNR
ncbi:MAG TPA: DUF3343 domain-containing protein [Chitinispirillaceae bacterium]|jgi:hypothetical protein|nr:DUF3343 domain-containing protein [Chitinispirillaceae bacterium]